MINHVCIGALTSDKHRQTVAAKAPSEDMMAAVAPYFEAEAHCAAPLRGRCMTQNRGISRTYPLVI